MYHLATHNTLHHRQTDRWADRRLYHANPTACSSTIS